MRARREKIICNRRRGAFGYILAVDQRLKPWELAGIAATQRGALWKASSPGVEPLSQPSGPPRSMRIQLPVGAAMSIPGITIYGVTGMLQGRDDPGPFVTNDPVYLSADYIERGIASGQLPSGCLRGVKVMPPPNAWPEEWLCLVNARE